MAVAGVIASHRQPAVIRAGANQAQVGCSGCAAPQIGGSLSPGGDQLSHK
jgi:hypothetical protein